MKNTAVLVFLFLTFRNLFCKNLIIQIFLVWASRATPVQMPTINGTLRGNFSRYKFDLKTSCPYLVISSRAQRIFLILKQSL